MIPEFFVQTKNGDLHAYFDPIVLRIHLAEMAESVRVFSRHHGVAGKVIYTEATCMTCFDHDDKCQECCPHDEHDHGHCLACDKDCTEDLAGAAEAWADAQQDR